jgi:3D (Asp-Asp-Asp) domain-containing protein
MKIKQHIVFSCFAFIAVGLCAFNIVSANKQTSINNGPLTISYPLKSGTDLIGETKAAKTRKILVVITAYSSTVDQTDETPFITANGTYVRDGIVANNMLPFGTKLKIPEIYGNKEFIVADRMNSKKSSYHIDVWMPSQMEAVNFGVKKAYIEVSEI